MMTSGDVACFIAEPIQGVGGFATPPDGLLGALQKTSGRPRDPLHLRRGADRLGPDRRALLGLPGARGDPRPADVRQGGRQRPQPRRSGRPGRDHRLDAGQLDLDVRRQPAVERRWPSPPSATYSSTTCKHNALVMGRRLRDAPRRRRRRRRVDRRGARQGADAGHRDGAARRPHPAARAGRASTSAASSAGLLIGKGGLYGNVLRIAPPLTVTAAEIDRAADIIADAIAATPPA